MASEPSSSRLRILHICPRPSFSGLEAYALAMAQAQAALGHDVFFAVLEGSPLQQKCLEAGLKTVVKRPGLKGQLAFITEITGFLGSRADRPDIVHLHSTQDLDMMIAPLTRSRLLGARRPRAILQTHIWISHTKKDPLHAISYSLIDEIWCSSRPARESLIRFLPIPARKIRVINYGRDVDMMERSFLPREDARRELGLPLDATVVGSVARIDEGKGTRELLEGTLRVMDKHPDLHLMLIGPPTADDPKAVAFGKMILERIANLPAPYTGRVHAPGAVPDSFKYMKAFDLFALPTYMECFALSLLEAQLAGVPCLATSTGGSPEVVIEGQTGWLFEPRSVDAVASTLERALHDRSLWPNFGDRARTRVWGEFDTKTVLPATIKAYEEVLCR